MELSSTVEHKHCFCNVDAGNNIICCKCGERLDELYDEPAAVLMWEQIGHNRDIISDMDEEFSTEGKTRIVKNRKAAIRRKARKQHICTECHLVIDRDAEYWEVTLNGSGVSSFVRPERVHDGKCLKNNLFKGEEDGRKVTR